MDPPKAPGEGLADQPLQHPAEPSSPHKPPQLWARHVPICIPTAHPTRSSSSQISMTLTWQESCKQLVMLVIVRVVCSGIKCHAAICVWICHDSHPIIISDTLWTSRAVPNDGYLQASGHHSRESGKRAGFTGVFRVKQAGQQHPPPIAAADLTSQPPEMCPAPEFLWNFLQFPHWPASTGPDCGMPASVRKAKPGALCNLQGPRRKNKRMHNPPASVSR